MSLGWSDFNPLSEDFLGGSFQRGSKQGPVDPYGDLKGQSGYAGDFADVGQRGYGRMTGEMDRDREFLRGQQRGENSVSAEQLRQGLQQQYGMAQSQAAGARPGSAPMAARTAMMGAGRAGSAMAGQQALAGLQERNMAAQQLAQLNQAQRAQDLQAALQARQNALQGYGQLEQSRTSRYAADMGVPSMGERAFGMGAGIAGLAMTSDKRAKKDIEPADDDADRLLRGLKAYRYKYKRPDRDGDGPQLGIMAQDLERAGLRQAVIDTPRGKVVHGAKLAGALAAMMPGINRRIEKLESGK